MGHEFLNSIYRSFIKSNSHFVTIIALGVAFIAWSFSPQKSVPLSLVVILVSLLLVFILTLISALYESLKSSGVILPEIISTRNIKVGNKTTLSILMKPSELFSINTLVSVYYQTEDDFEVLLGFGQIANIQQNKFIQVWLVRSLEEQSKIIDKIRKNEATSLRKIRIKPTIPKDYIEN